MSFDLTFLANEPGKSLLNRFQALLGTNTRFFDCLVGYCLTSSFFISDVQLLRKPKK
jgi:hypothetical protein